VATHIIQESDVVHSLFEDTQASEREHRLTSALDAINGTFGRGTVKLAAQGTGRIKSASEKQSPHYTTLWDDLPKVSVK
jgi:DNA polymerase V